MVIAASDCLSAFCEVAVLLVRAGELRAAGRSRRARRSPAPASVVDLLLQRAWTPRSSSSAPPPSCPTTSARGAGRRARTPATRRPTTANTTHARDEHDPPARPLRRPGRACGRDVDAVAQRADHRGGTRGVVVVELVRTTRRRCRRSRARARGRRATAAGSRARPRAVAGVRGRACSAIDGRPRPGARASTSRSSASVAWRCGSSRLRRSANTMPVAPSASTTTGRIHTSRLTPESCGAEQDRLAVRCRCRPGGSASSLCPAAIRRLMSARIARDVGAWLSATERPWHSGHLSCGLEVVGTRRVDWSPLGHSTTASAITTTTPSAIHGPHSPDHSERSAPRRGTSRARPTTSARTSPPRPRRRARSRRSRVGPRRRSRARRSFCGSSATVHPTSLSLHVGCARRRSVSSRTMPTIAKSGSSLCAA